MTPSLTSPPPSASHFDHGKSCVPGISPDIYSVADFERVSQMIHAEAGIGVEGRHRGLERRAWNVQRLRQARQRRRALEVAVGDQARGRTRERLYAAEPVFPQESAVADQKGGNRALAGAQLAAHELVVRQRLVHEAVPLLIDGDDAGLAAVGDGVRKDGRRAVAAGSKKTMVTSPNQWRFAV